MKYNSKYGTHFSSPHLMPTSKYYVVRYAGSALASAAGGEQVRNV